MTIGENIKIARKKAGLKQNELAERMGITQSTIAMFENDKTNIKLSTVRKISEALHLPMSEIIGENWGLFPHDELRSDFCENLDEIAKSYKKLNTIGKQEAVKRVEELTHIEKYTKEK